MSLLEKVTRLNDAAEAAGVRVVTDFVLRNENGLEAVVPYDAALELLSALKPPVLYLDQRILDRNALVAQYLEELGIDEEDDLAAEVIKAASALRQYEGQLGEFDAHFVVGSVLHTTGGSAEWLEAFESAAGQIRASADEKRSIERSQLDRTQSEKVGKLARRLMAEPAFTHGRVSYAKRLELARHMFLDEEEAVLCGVVDKAEQLHWLTESGFFDR